MHNIQNLWVWASFIIFVIFALSLDTLITEKHHSAGPHTSLRAAFIWSLIWISSALIFNALLWIYLYSSENILIANQKALDFFAGYLIEKTLSIDNLFAFYMVFHQLRIPVAYQRRVFAYGIWSAIVLRLAIILLGTWAVSRYHWILYVLGAFLIFTGIKMFFFKDTEKEIKQSAAFHWIKRLFRITDELQGQRFFIIKHNMLYATRIFIALIFIEISDIIFAFDSIPAIFAITRDPFIVWTSNIFAILGLRSLYFILSGMVERFRLLKYGIALILVFVGCKMSFEYWFEISTLFSLGVIAAILISFVLMSIYTQKEAHH